MKFKIIIFIFLYLFLSRQALAADLTITCPDGEENCFASGTEFINQSNLYPGIVSSPQTITVINQKLDDECQLKFTIKNLQDNLNLSSKSFLRIYDNQTAYFNGYLNQLIDNYQNLSVIQPQSQKEFKLSFGLSKTIDNQYQNSNFTFDMDFNFICTPIILGETTTKQTDSESTPEVKGSSSFFSNLLNNEITYILLLLFTSHLLISIMKNINIKKPKAL